jgi:hypothetical protein
MPVSAGAAVLDANVLYPVSLCDTLLRCALAGLYRPLWTAQILEEATRNLVADGRATRAGAARRVQHMQGAFPHALVSGYEDLIPLLQCDPKDRHVLAAAVRGKAQWIVTQNLADFPLAALQPYAVEARHPDQFLTDIFEHDPDAVVQALRRQAAALRNPPMPVEQVLAVLAIHVPSFVSLIRSARQLDEGCDLVL